MSKGHSKWERLILGTLQKTAAFYLTDLLPVPHTRSHVVALNRAARNLLNAGKIATAYWQCRATGNHGFITIYRVGYPMPTRDQPVLAFLA
jgi:hypothetical protein